MGEEKRQASDRPQRGRGRPAGCRGGFEGGAQCLGFFVTGVSRLISRNNGLTKLWADRNKRRWASDLFQ